LEAGSAFCSHCGYGLEAPGEVKPAEPTFAIAGDLQPGAYLKTGWQLFKQYPLGFVGFTVIYIIILAVISYPRGIGWLAAAAIHEPLIAGFIIVTAKLLQQRTPKFSDFFSGFQFQYLLPLALVGLISTLFISIGLILLIVPGVYLAVSYVFAPIMVIDQGLDFWSAMEQSRRSVTPRWFGFFAFLLLLVLVNLGGILALGVGILVTIPLSWCALTVAYAEIFGLKSQY
jgi:uncharacterized membrane protein